MGNQNGKEVSFNSTHPNKLDISTLDTNKKSQKTDMMPNSVVRNINADVGHDDPGVNTSKRNSNANEQPRFSNDDTPINQNLDNCVASVDVEDVACSPSPAQHVAYGHAGEENVAPKCVIPSESAIEPVEIKTDAVSAHKATNETEVESVVLKNTSCASTSDSEMAVVHDAVAVITNDEEASTETVTEQENKKTMVTEKTTSNNTASVSNTESVFVNVKNGDDEPRATGTHDLYVPGGTDREYRLSHTDDHKHLDALDGESEGNTNDVSELFRESESVTEATIAHTAEDAGASGAAGASKGKEKKKRTKKKKTDKQLVGDHPHSDAHAHAQAQTQAYVQAQRERNEGGGKRRGGRDSEREREKEQSYSRRSGGEANFRGRGPQGISRGYGNERAQGRTVDDGDGGYGGRSGGRRRPEPVIEVHGPRVETAAEKARLDAKIAEIKRRNEEAKIRQAEIEKDKERAVEREKATRERFAQEQNRLEKERVSSRKQGNSFGWGEDKARGWGDTSNKGGRETEAGKYRDQRNQIQSRDRGARPVRGKDVQAHSRSNVKRREEEAKRVAEEAKWREERRLVDESRVQRAMMTSETGESVWRRAWDKEKTSDNREGVRPGGVRLPPRETRSRPVYNEDRSARHDRRENYDLRDLRDGSLTPTEPRRDREDSPEVNDNTKQIKEERDISPSAGRPRSDWADYGSDIID
eukprot:CFRG0128T1